jgi:hypothetical protein
MTKKEMLINLRDNYGIDNREMIDFLNKEIERLNGLNQKLVSANGSLLQQVSMSTEKSAHPTEDDPPKKSFNFRDAFDEKGHFKQKM